MLRAALAALFVAAALLAAASSAAAVSAWTVDAALAAGAIHPAAACPDAGGSAEWHAPPARALSTIESAWKWRSVHAALADAHRPRAAAPARAAAPSSPLAPAAPEHLRHTPLLI